ncbi:hypothetical protein [Nocardioides sp. SYSU D00038]|uniref:hypothetical protein n=1 Tax=Nocardioides sp. SYSU D00038 TaxID=2812554 RepID=UPI0019682A3A|nr:hypothetical protein [Nocardioides sp. SYSU D00038]
MPLPGAYDDGLVEPLPRPLARLLRTAAYDLATSEPRRVHPPLVHVGQPRTAEAVVAVRPDEPTDHALRTDVLAAMLRRVRAPTLPTPGPLVWLTRTGPLEEVQDVDARWLAAARAAHLEAGLALVFVVVNRHGWRDPRSGTQRRWQRLRRR